MALEDLTTIENIFSKVLEVDQSQRQSKIDEFCYDNQILKEEVESLIKQYEHEPDFINRSALTLLYLLDTAKKNALSNLEVENNLPYERLGGFKLIRRLGNGGMGVVYLAVQESLGRQVALKVIHPDRMGSLEIVTRFWREIESVSSLQHSNIVTVYGNGCENGVFYYAMEHLSGNSLDQILHVWASTGEGRGSWRQIVEWIRDIANALEYVHQAGIIHRDVKPSNILMSCDQRPVLVDFGVARAMNCSTMTFTGSFRGTPYYASYEQVKAGSHSISTLTDIYSLGVTLYEAVCGRVPFEGETTEQIFNQILNSDPISPRQLNPAIPRDLETVILKTIEKLPRNRYLKMADFANDLQRVLDGDIIDARPAALAHRIHKKIRRHPALTASTTTVSVSIIGFLIYLLCLFFPQLKEESQRAWMAEQTALEAEQSAVLQRNRIEEQLTSITRLSDIKIIDDLNTELQQLLPASRTKIPALVNWIAKAEGVASRLPIHRGNLSYLKNNFSHRVSFENCGEFEWRAILDIHAMAVESIGEDVAWYKNKINALIRQDFKAQEILNYLRKQLKEIGVIVESNESSDASSTSVIVDEDESPIIWKIQYDILRQYIDFMETQFENYTAIRFSEANHEWQYDSLSNLITNIEALIEDDGPLMRVKILLEEVQNQNGRSAKNYGKIWKNAIDSIADFKKCPLYCGLVITPQIGLKPIGQNPQSGLWEFAHLKTGVPPKRDAQGRIILAEDSGLVFVLIPGGEFAMGASKPSENATVLQPNEDPETTWCEEPVRRISISPFFISKYEMTQSQWKRITGHNPSGFKETSLPPPSALYPVENIEWEIAHETLFALNLRLPTEAEWEYSARGGTTTVYWTGNQKETLEGVANIADTNIVALYPYIFFEKWLNDGWAHHAPVGSFRENPFGLYDVCGNIMEFCQDVFYSGYQKRPVDGSACEYLDDSLRGRVVKGGSYHLPAKMCRSAYRGRCYIGTAATNFGVRPARSLAQK